MAKGKLIVFEGIDGAGSSTQLELLHKYLKKKKVKAIKTANPSSLVLGKLIRRVLQGKVKISRKAIQLLYCADRDDHLEKVILPALKAGNVVLCDRYYYSTIAYGSLHLHTNWLKKITEDTLRPDITFFVNTSVKVAMGRMAARKKKEYFEKEQWLKKVSKNYLEMMKSDKICVLLDGAKPKEKIFEEVLQVIKNRKYI